MPQFGYDDDKFDGLSLAELESEVFKVTRRIRSRIVDYGYYAGGGAFIVYADGVLTATIPVVGDEGLRTIGNYGGRLTGSSTVAGVAVVPYSSLEMGDIQEYADHSAEIRAPIYVTTSLRRYNSALKRNEPRLLNTHRITSDDTGKAVCMNLSQNEEC